MKGPTRNFASIQVGASWLFSPETWLTLSIPWTSPLAAFAFLLFWGGRCPLLAPAIPHLIHTVTDNLSTWGLVALIYQVLDVRLLKACLFFQGSTWHLVTDLTEICNVDLLIFLLSWDTWFRDQTYVPCIAGGFFNTEPPGKPLLYIDLYT